MRLCGSAMIAAVAVFSLWVAGCGGGDDGHAEAAAKARFIRKVDAICESANKAQFVAMGVAGTSGKPESLVGRERAVMLPPIQKEAEKIAELRPPPGGEKEVATIVKGIEEAVAKAERDPVHDFEQPFIEVDKRAVRYGFHRCVGLIVGSG